MPTPDHHFLDVLPHEAPVSDYDHATALWQRAQSILVVCRPTETIDSLAAALCLRQLAQHTDQHLTIVSLAPIPREQQFLPQSDDIRTKLAEGRELIIRVATSQAELDRIKYTVDDGFVHIHLTPKEGQFLDHNTEVLTSIDQYDLIITLDCQSPADMGPLYTQHTDLWAQTPILNLSANPKNQDYGTTNLIEPHYSTTCEVVWEWLKHMQRPKNLSPTSLSLLLTGVISHTGRFLEPHTTAHALNTAAQLQALGAQHTEIIDHLYKQKSLPTLKLWGAILSRLQFDPVLRCAWSSVRLNDLTPAGLSLGNITDELLRHIDGADVVVLFREGQTEHTIEVRASGRAHLFHALTASTPHKRVARHHGVDLIIPDGSFDHVQAAFLQSLQSFMQHRLQLDSSITLSPISVQLPPAHSTPLAPVMAAFSAVTAPAQGSSTPSAPASVPFQTITQESRA